MIVVFSARHILCALNTQCAVIIHNLYRQRPYHRVISNAFFARGKFCHGEGEGSSLVKADVAEHRACGCFAGGNRHTDLFSGCREVRARNIRIALNILIGQLQFESEDLFCHDRAIVNRDELFNLGLIVRRGRLVRVGVLCRVLIRLVVVVLCTRLILSALHTQLAVQVLNDHGQRPDDGVIGDAFFARCKFGCREGVRSSLVKADLAEECCIYISTCCSGRNFQCDLFASGREVRSRNCRIAFNNFVIECQLEREDLLLDSRTVIGCDNLFDLGLIFHRFRLVRVSVLRSFSIGCVISIRLIRHVICALNTQRAVIVHNHHSQRPDR